MLTSKESPNVGVLLICSLAINAISFFAVHEDRERYPRRPRLTRERIDRLILSRSMQSHNSRSIRLIPKVWRVVASDNWCEGHLSSFWRLLFHLERNFLLIAMHGSMSCGSHQKIWECGLFWIQLHVSRLPRKLLLPELQSLERCVLLDSALQHSCRCSGRYFQTLVLACCTAYFHMHECIISSRCCKKVHESV